MARLQVSVLKVSLAALALGASGCTLTDPGHVGLSSPQLSYLEGFDDRNWGDARTVGPFESPEAGPNSYSVRGFDLQAFGNEAWLGMSVYHPPVDGGSGEFVGYLRGFSSDEGWATAGPDFGIFAASSAGNDLGAVGIGAAEKSPFAVFHSSSGSEIVAPAKDGTYWTVPAGSNISTNAHSFSLRNGGIFQPAPVVAEGPHGRSWSFFTPALIGGNIYTARPRLPDGGVGVSPDLFSSGSNGALPFVDVAVDASNLCASYWEVDLNSFPDATDDEATLYVRCFMGLNSSLTTIGTAVSLHTNTGVAEGGIASGDYEQLAFYPGLWVNTNTGHALAAGGGGMMIAYLSQGAHGAPAALVARPLSDGSPDGPEEVISSGMPEGYRVLGNANPGLVHVGGGDYLAVWSAYQDDTDTSAVFYSEYDRFQGWNDPAVLTSVSGYEFNIYRSIVLEGNGKGGAVLAFRYVSDAAVDASADGIWGSNTRVKVGRYHASRGWLSLENKGSDCQMAVDPATPGTGDAYACASLPRAALLEDGAAIVSFLERIPGGLVWLSATAFR